MTKITNFFQILAVIIAVTGLTTADQYPSCSDAPDTGILNGASISGCTPGQTCVLHKGDIKDLQIDFTSTYASDSLEVDIYAIASIFPVPLPYPGFDTNGCNSKYNINCPLAANQPYSYKNVLSVPSVIPTMDLQAKVQLKDSSSRTIVCFLVDLHLQN